MLYVIYLAFLFNIICYIISFKQKTVRYLSITNFWSLASALLLCFTTAIVYFSLHETISPFWNSVYLFSIFLATVYYCSKLNKAYNRYQAVWLQKLAIIFLVLATVLLPTILILYSFNNFRFIEPLQINYIIEYTIILRKLGLLQLCEVLYLVFILTSGITFYNYLKFNARFFDKLLAGSVAFFCFIIYVNLIIIPENVSDTFKNIYGFLHSLSVVFVLVSSGLKYIDKDAIYKKEKL